MTYKRWHSDKDDFSAVVKYLLEQPKKLKNYLSIAGLPFDSCDEKPELDIEHLCTILDLNLKRPLILKGTEADLTDVKIPFMKGLTLEVLKGARDFIHHYVVTSLLPERLSPNEALLKRFCAYVNKHESLITFNYDLLVEQTLWKMGLWNPMDGYGKGIADYVEGAKIDARDFPKSQVSVIKLHGSLNWHTDWLNKLEIRTTHPFTGTPLFEGMKGHGIQRARRYPLTSHAILPTFMKGVRYRWEIQLVKMASDAISSAQEVFILGYSLPEADTMASFIFTHVPNDAHITIVDSGAPKRLTNRLVKKYGLNIKNIIHERSDIKKWIKNDFQCLSYERDKPNREYAGHLAKLSRKHS